MKKEVTSGMKKGMEGVKGRVRGGVRRRLKGRDDKLRKTCRNSH
jgi:hypothetical protein